MFVNSQKINIDNLPDTFADHFYQKVNDIVNSAEINPAIYNGNKKINGNNACHIAIRSCDLNEEKMR